MTGFDVLRGSLRAAGVAAVYGRPLGGVAVEVDDLTLAAVLARADERTHPHLTAIHEGDQVLRFGTGRPRSDTTVHGLDDVPSALERAVGARWSTPDEAVVLRIAADLGAACERPPVVRPMAPPAWSSSFDDSVVNDLRAAERVLFLVGPGVL